MTLPEAIPQLPGPQLVAIVKQETAELDAYLATLPPEALERPSSAPGWTIADVAAHVAMGADGYSTYIRRALLGDATVPPGFPGPTQAHLNPNLSAITAQRTRDFRQSLGDPVLPAFRTKCSQFHQLLDSLTSDDWNKPAYHGRRTTTIRGLVLTRVSEVCLHTWDLKAGLEPSPGLHPHALPALVEWLPSWFYWGFYPPSTLSEPLRYRFHLSTPVPGIWDIVVLGDQFQVEPATPEPAATTFRCDPETAVLVFMGRVPWQSALDQGLLTIEGDPQQATTFFNIFRST